MARFKVYEDGKVLGTATDMRVSGTEINLEGVSAELERYLGTGRQVDQLFIHDEGAESWIRAPGAFARRVNSTRSTMVLEANGTIDRDAKPYWE